MIKVLKYNCKNCNFEYFEILKNKQKAKYSKCLKCNAKLKPDIYSFPSITLETCYFIQKNLSEFYNKIRKEYKSFTNIDKIRIMTLALIDEIMEMLNETSWKPWKDKKEIDKSKLIEEFADILHFYLQLLLYFDISVQDILTKYVEKAQKNIERQLKNKEYNKQIVLFTSYESLCEKCGSKNICKGILNSEDYAKLCINFEFGNSKEEGCFGCVKRFNCLEAGGRKKLFKCIYFEENSFENNGFNSLETNGDV